MINIRLKAFTLYRVEKGFTLIELLTAVVIIGLLASVVTISSVKALQKNRDSRRKADINLIASALEKYYYSNRVYPGNAWRYPKNSTQPSPWIPNISNYLNPLPVERGPDVGGTYNTDNPCWGDVYDIYRTYEYFTDSGDVNIPSSGYFLMARLELTGDPSLTSIKTECSCRCGINEPGLDILFGKQVQKIRGYPIYAIYSPPIITP